MRSTMQIAGHPIHPMLIPLPFGLWFTSVVVNLIASRMDQSRVQMRLHNAAYYMVLAGCIGALLAAIPGVIDLFTAIPGGTRARRRGLIHGLLNVLALAF